MSIQQGDRTITAEGLRRSFGDFEAVAGVDLHVDSGEILGFLGPNGAGKTTLVRMLTTLLAPSSGKATVAGYDVVREPQRVRSAIGVALQEAGLDGLATGRELLRMHARLYGLGRRDSVSRGEELLETVGLEDAANRRVSTYSGGMRRRLDLAIALVHVPRVLFLDEPTSGLDPASRSVIWELVRDLREQRGVTIFLTTQYLEEADRLADRISIIDRGRIVKEGTPAALKSEVGSDVIRLDVGSGAAPDCAGVRSLRGVRSTEMDGDTLVVFASDGGAALPEVLAELTRNGISVHHASVDSPTLDDVFLAVTGASR
jgi:ABC-2 type transport system ATP-binding protein